MDLRVLQLVCIIVFVISTEWLILPYWDYNPLIAISYLSAWLYLIAGLAMKFEKEDKEKEYARKQNESD